MGAKFERRRTKRVGKTVKISMFLVFIGLIVMVIVVYNLYSRIFVSNEEETAIRDAAYQALLKVMKSSGRSLAEVDAFFFGFRKLCPEMEEPNCRICILNAVCLKEKELFQPVFRTTFY